MLGEAPTSEAGRLVVRLREKHGAIVRVGSPPLAGCRGTAASPCCTLHQVRALSSRGCIHVLLFASATPCTLRTTSLLCSWR